MNRGVDVHKFLLYLFLLILILPKIALANFCPDIFSKTFDLQLKIKRDLETYPNLDPTISWDPLGRQYELSATVEIKTQQSRAWTGLALYGFPYTRDGKDYVLGKVWQDKKGKVIGLENRVLEEYPLQKIYDQGVGESFFKYTEYLATSVLLIPSDPRKSTFVPAHYVSHNKTHVVLKVIGGSEVTLPKYEVFKWNVFFRSRGDNTFVEEFYDSGGRGLIILNSTTEQDGDYPGLFIYPQRLPLPNSGFWSTPLAYAQVIDLQSKEVPFLIYNFAKGDGYFFPKENNILQQFRQAHGITLQGAIVIKPRTEPETIDHEYQHYQDYFGTLINEMFAFFDNVETEQTFSNMGFSPQKETLLAKVLIEQRGYTVSVLGINRAIELIRSNQGLSGKQKAQLLEPLVDRKKRVISFFITLYIEPIFEELEEMKSNFPDMYQKLYDYFISNQLSEPSGQLDLNRLLP